LARAPGAIWLFAAKMAGTAPAIFCEEILFVAQKLSSAAENIESALEKIRSGLQQMLSMTEIKL
jgi:hypothetical protein